MNAKSAGSRLNELLRAAGEGPLDEATSSRFEVYISLFIRWNKRVNLSSIRDEEGILSRHFVESIILARRLPAGVNSLLDFGSGAGLPGIPIALCRPEIAVTLAESQNKKAAFLQEAVRELAIRAVVHAGRAEALRAVFECVALRAVDKMPEAVTAATRLIAARGWLALMTTDAGLAQLHAGAGAGFTWADPVRLPGSESRLVSLGQRISS